MTRFSVTYERFLPHGDDEEVCEADESGFVIEGGTLREALDAMNSHNVEPSCSPFTGEDHAWFRNTDDNDGTREFYEQGITESRALHPPRNLTPSSRRRVARLLGVTVARR